MRTPEERAEKLANRHPVCKKNPEHGALHYFESADTYACLKCDEWRDEEPPCGDPGCVFCTKRTAKPSLVS